MSIEEKIKKAQQIYSDMQMSFDGYENTRLDSKLGADLIYPSENQRGTGGIIILDDGKYYVCGSQKSAEEYYKDFMEEINIKELVIPELKDFKEHYSSSVLTDEEIINIIVLEMNTIILNLN